MDFIEKLEQWANVNSYSHNVAGLEKMVHIAQKEFSSLKPDEMKELPIGLSLKKRADAPFKVFLGGHLDTVFSANHSFQTAKRLDEERLQGPGVADMKGGILVLLQALLEFEASPLAENLGWEIFLNLDEEIGSPNSTPFLQECAKRCDCALLFEPALPDGALASERKGSSNYHVVSKGKEAHAGRNAEEGVNAIFSLVRFLAAIENLPNALVNVGTITGGRAVNIIPDHAEAKLNVRSDIDYDSILQEKAKECCVSITKTNFRPPKKFDEKTKKLFELLKGCGEELNIPVKWRATGGVCDGNTFGAAGIPTIDSLGVEGGGLHTDEEFVYLPSMLKKAQLTFHLLKELARRKEI